jgi:hypothetical protein
MGLFHSNLTVLLEDLTEELVMAICIFMGFFLELAFNSGLHTMTILKQNGAGRITLLYGIPYWKTVVTNIVYFR